MVFNLQQCPLRKNITLQATQPCTVYCYRTVCRMYSSQPAAGFRQETAALASWLLSNARRFWNATVSVCLGANVFLIFFSGRAKRKYNFINHASEKRDPHAMYSQHTTHLHSLRGPRKEHGPCI